MWWSDRTSTRSILRGAPVESLGEEPTRLIGTVAAGQGGEGPELDGCGRFFTLAMARDSG